MPLRLLVALAILLLSACANASARKAAIDDMERRHTEDMQRMGGGGGSM